MIYDDDAGIIQYHHGVVAGRAEVRIGLTDSHIVFFLLVCEVEVRCT